MKPRKPIRRVSTGRANQLREYEKVKRGFLGCHSYCSVCHSWVSPHSRQLHHVYGRVGRLLTWNPGFLMACKLCHQYIHNRPTAAILGGYLGPTGTFNDYERALKHHESLTK